MKLKEILTEAHIGASTVEKVVNIILSTLEKTKKGDVGNFIKDFSTNIKNSDIKYSSTKEMVKVLGSFLKVITGESDTKYNTHTFKTALKKAKTLLSNKQLEVSAIFTELAGTLHEPKKPYTHAERKPRAIPAIIVDKNGDEVEKAIVDGEEVSILLVSNDEKTIAVITKDDEDWDIPIKDFFDENPNLKLKSYKW